MSAKILELLKKEVDSCLNIYCVLASPSSFVFEERVKALCFHCASYSTKWTCPQKMPKINYEKVFSEYKNGLLVYCKFDNIKEEEFPEIRKKSTNLLHKELLKLEKICWNNNLPMAISFIGGGCKLCKNGCADDKCRNPYLARIPLEATGINVIKSLEKIEIDVSFPVKETLCRYGLLLF